MTRASRNAAATLPVSRNIVAPHVNLGTALPLGPLTTIEPTGYTCRKGRAKQKVGMWGTLSQNHRTPITHDPKWSRTVSDRIS